jgi:hypothetical protein
LIKVPLPCMRFEVAHDNQGVDGFADRGSPDTQHAGQITLGGKLGAGRQLTARKFYLMICSATISGAELLRMVSKAIGFLSVKSFRERGLKRLMFAVRRIISSCRSSVKSTK